MGVESYPVYPVKEGQRYINRNPGRLFVIGTVLKNSNYTR